MRHESERAQIRDRLIIRERERLVAKLLAERRAAQEDETP